VVTAFLVVTPGAVAGKPFVSVQAMLKRVDGGAEVPARVEWNADAARQSPAAMTVGNLRLVAVSEDGHHPTLLDATTYEDIDKNPVQEVILHVDKKDADAIAPGNRVVLTASQHGLAPGTTRSTKTFVTVDQLQQFDSPQDRIGRRDCADVAIEVSAELQQCDLVGAYLDRAQVSVRDKPKTNMRIADLTGATMQGANLSGLNVAGGRLNGVDASGALFNNVYIAGAEATRLDAENAKITDPTGGANTYDARLVKANFQGSELDGVSLNHADLDGADFRNATWNAVEAATASFRGADLSGFRGETPNVYLADFTDAKLHGAPFTDTNLQWTTLCGTEMPDGKISDRDCPDKVKPEPASEPKVAVKGSLDRSPDEATVRAAITWNAPMLARMSAGDIRVLAIDRSTGVPTEIISEPTQTPLPSTTTREWKITEPAKLKAMGGGNRVVLTATQHAPPPRGELTEGSFVTVDQLQAGPGRGEIGKRDCSDRMIGPSAPEGTLNYCDLAGAALSRAKLSGAMRDTDLTGAELQDAGMVSLTLDGSAMGGADMGGAELANVDLITVSAPRLDLTEASIRGSKLRASELDGTDFELATIRESTLAASGLQGAIFSAANLEKVDLAFTALNGAKLDEVDAKPLPSSLFLADLTGATLAASQWAKSEEGEVPWQLSTLCHTTLPEKKLEDRDCPR
jgi:uncharacterized protein YjbI with pentapeptide repeats